MAEGDTKKKIACTRHLVFTPRHLTCETSIATADVTTNTSRRGPKAIREADLGAARVVKEVCDADHVSRRLSGRH